MTSLFSRLQKLNTRCRLGLHRWERLGTMVWLEEPMLARNELLVAMKYRACERCPAITDVSAFLSGEA